MTQLEHIIELVNYFDLLTSNSQEVTDINFINDDMVEMRWKYHDDFVQSNPRTNVVIAAYTTAQARLQLYNDLDCLKDRAMYCDTDSIIYHSTPKECKLPTGNFLGQLTNEITDGEITHYVSGGPKNYALKVRADTGDYSIVKVRGITLNYATSLQIDFDAVKEIVDCPDKTIVTRRKHIRRKARERQLVTREEDKDYRLVFNKRVVQSDYTTHPYGF